MFCSLYKRAQSTSLEHNFKASRAKHLLRMRVCYNVLGKDVTDIIFCHVHRLHLQAVNKEFLGLIISENPYHEGTIRCRCKIRPTNGFIFGSPNAFFKGRIIQTWNGHGRRQEQIIKYPQKINYYWEARPLVGETQKAI